MGMCGSCSGACKSCGGTGRYVSLLCNEVCKDCGGSGRCSARTSAETETKLDPVLDPNSTVKDWVYHAFGNKGDNLVYKGVDLAEGLLIDVLTGASLGQEYWLAEGGGVSSAMPARSGRRLIRMGWALSDRDLWVSTHDAGVMK